MSRHDSRKDTILKVIALGDQFVGKSALLAQFAAQHFADQPTIGADFLTKRLVVDDRRISLQLWDMVGQERFQSFTGIYGRGADCCVLVYVTDAASFKSLDSWHNAFLDKSNPRDPDTFPFVLLGNKIDIANKRVVSSDQAQEWCRTKNNMPYFETSAKQSINVEEAFDVVVKAALQRHDQLNADAPDLADFSARFRLANSDHGRNGGNGRRKCNCT